MHIIFATLLGLQWPLVLNLWTTSACYKTQFRILRRFQNDCNNLVWQCWIKFIICFTRSGSVDLSFFHLSSFLNSQENTAWFDVTFVRSLKANRKVKKREGFYSLADTEKSLSPKPIRSIAFYKSVIFLYSQMCTAHLQQSRHSCAMESMMDGAARLLLISGAKQVALCGTSLLCADPSQLVPHILMQCCIVQTGCQLLKLQVST